MITPDARPAHAPFPPPVERPSEPRLAPPGAGLPRVELAVARGLFALRRRLGTRAWAAAAFERERAEIRGLVCGSDARRRGERVLIGRLRGLEDSSRFWSVWMTLDHLRIANSQIAMVISGLPRGRVPQHPASTAAVKPDPGVTGAVEEAYERSCDALVAAAGEVADLRTAARFAHPWFGPLDAAGWHFLAGVHMGIHRAQLRRILEGLGRVRADPS